jgi:hypothetical protein
MTLKMNFSRKPQHLITTLEMKTKNGKKLSVLNTYLYESGKMSAFKSGKVPLFSTPPLFSPNQPSPFPPPARFTSISHLIPLQAQR